PYVRHPPANEIFEFYAAIAQASDGLPVWIQNNTGPIGTPMNVDLVVRMLVEIPGVDFIKEESEYAPQAMSRVRELAADHLRGVMGGMGGRFLLEEYRRGACGTVPASEVADAHVLLWDALERGDEDDARHIHTILLPLLNYESLYTYAIYKEILVRRGVIASARSRVPGAPQLDAENQREIDALLRDLAPLLTLGLRPEIDI
ncbi:MAG TPA: dihydrodipicolinate synthase family protein, partial [Nitrolancea sp.]|nr:dihydrodipicolinate synthase family protein [Nitrolancea sp.]